MSSDNYPWSTLLPQEILREQLMKTDYDSLLTLCVSGDDRFPPICNDSHFWDEKLAYELETRNMTPQEFFELSATNGWTKFAAMLLTKYDILHYLKSIPKAAQNNHLLMVKFLMNYVPNWISQVEKEIEALEERNIEITREIDRAYEEYNFVSDIINNKIAPLQEEYKNLARSRIEFYFQDEEQLTKKELVLWSELEEEMKEWNKKMKKLKEDSDDDLSRYESSEESSHDEEVSGEEISEELYMLPNMNPGTSFEQEVEGDYNNKLSDIRHETHNLKRQLKRINNVKKQRLILKKLQFLSEQNERIAREYADFMDAIRLPEFKELSDEIESLYDELDQADRKHADIVQPLRKTHRKNYERKEKLERKFDYWIGNRKLVLKEAYNIALENGRIKMVELLKSHESPQHLQTFFGRITNSQIKLYIKSGFIQSLHTPAGLLLVHIYEQTLEQMEPFSHIEHKKLMETINITRTLSFLSEYYGPEGVKILENIVFPPDFPEEEYNKIMTLRGYNHRMYALLEGLRSKFDFVNAIMTSKFMPK